MKTASVAIGCVFLPSVFLGLAAAVRSTASGHRSDVLQTDKASYTYFIDDGEPSSGYRSPDRELAAWAFAAWERNSGGGLHLQPSREPEALVRLYWASANGTTYGEMRAFLMNGRRGAAVFVRPDITALGPDIASRGTQDPL